MSATPKKLRLDTALVERGIVESREKAQRLIMAGQVRLNTTTASKPSQRVAPLDLLTLAGREKFVSRGGLKLEAALEQFGIACRDRVCLDLGASTGGFCDCLLHHGARKIYAVDVGRNQLAWRLRQDPRIRVLDRTNARYLEPSLLEELPDLVTADVSFISLCKILPAAVRCAGTGAEFVLLIKPQFEAGRRLVESGGVIRDPSVHEAVVARIREFAEQSLKARWRGLMESPLLGPAGNKEFLAWFELVARASLPVWTQARRPVPPRPVPPFCSGWNLSSYLQRKKKPL